VSSRTAFGGDVSRLAVVPQRVRSGVSVARCCTELGIS
jgi:hypothetical protein